MAFAELPSPVSSLAEVHEGRRTLGDVEKPKHGRCWTALAFAVLGSATVAFLGYNLCELGVCSAQAQWIDTTALGTVFVPPAAVLVLHLKARCHEASLRVAVALICMFVGALWLLPANYGLSGSATARLGSPFMLATVLALLWPKSSS